MSDGLIIIAQANEPRFLLIVAAVVVVFHVISKAFGKKIMDVEMQNSLQRVRDTMQQDRVLAQRRVVKPAQLAPNVALRVPPRVQQPRRAKGATVQTKRPAQAAIAQPVARSAPVEPPAPVTATAKKPSVKVNAPALHTWLRPGTLRQQFILTEIFQPPLALRSETNSL
jgi:hypothetical protein